MDLLMMPIYIFVFLFGITVGSFLNVCILRIPAGESFVTGSSHCMTCGKRLCDWFGHPYLAHEVPRRRP